MELHNKSDSKWPAITKETAKERCRILPARGLGVSLPECIRLSLRGATATKQSMARDMGKSYEIASSAPGGLAMTGGTRRLIKTNSALS